MTRLECHELALLYARLVASKDSAAAAVLTALHEHVITAPIDPTTDGPLNDNDSPTNSSPDWDRPLTAAERAKRYRESRKSSRTVTQNRDASRDGRDEFRDDRDGLRDASRASEPLPLSSFQGESAMRSWIRTLLQIAPGCSVSWLSRACSVPCSHPPGRNRCSGLPNLCSSRRAFRSSL